MAIAKSRKFDDSAMRTPNSLNTFFQEMGVPSAIDGSYVYVTLDEGIQVRVRGYVTGGGTFYADLVINGSVTDIGMVNYYCTTICIYSDTLFYLLFFNSGYDNRRACVFLEKIDGYWFYGGSGTSGSGFIPINNFSLSSTLDNNTYSHRAVLDYTAPSNSVDYTSDSLFVSDTIYISDPNTIACTAVSAGNVITLNGENYFALSANNLILLTDG